MPIKPAAGSRSFLDIKPFAAFDQVLDPKVFAPVPDDALVGISDIVSSTEAIEAGRYKAVNMAGASAIVAVMNALDGKYFPFVFGGDGASFLVESGDRDKVGAALSATARWAAEQLQLNLRTALVPVSEIRAAGHDFQVARYEASSNISYAMFSGGGVSWADREVKAGRFLLPLAPPGTEPDLEGLSCRWSELVSEHGTILSLIVRPAPTADRQAFNDIVRQVLSLLERREESSGQPISERNLKTRWPPSGFELEARAASSDRPMWRRRLRLYATTLFAFFLFTTGMRAGGFDPSRYRSNIIRNSDFRKFDDGLRMTVDCKQQTADELELLLAEAAAAGTLEYGTHRQDAAIMTCVVPSMIEDNHFHFLDGAAGGYATAAQKLKMNSAAQ